MIYIIVIALLSLMANSLQAAEPIIKPEKQPSTAKLELYEDSEELFVEKVLDLYRTSILLEAQIKILGAKPKTSIITPTMEDLESADANFLRKLYKVNNELLKQVESLEDYPVNREVAKIRKKVIQMSSEADSLKALLTEYQLLANSATYYRELALQLHEVLRASNLENDKRVDDIYKNAQSEVDRVRQIYTSSSNLVSPNLSLELGALAMFQTNSRLAIDLVPNLALNLNTDSFMGFGRNLELYFAFAMPNINVTYADRTVYQWNNHIYSLGGRICFDNVFNISLVETGFKVGGGVFFGTGSAPNFDGANQWRGNQFDVEMFFTGPNRYYPAELYIAYQLTSFTRNLNFDVGNRQFNAGKPNWNSLRFGLRVNLWKTDLKEVKQ